MISLDDFKKTIPGRPAPPASYSIYLQALWYDAKGEWNQAHNLIDDLENTVANRLHAYLHRKEGDESNAAYWYHRAGQPPAKNSLQEEWDALAREEHLAAATSTIKSDLPNASSCIFLFY